jgi:hypothetical protein
MILKIYYYYYYLFFHFGSKNKLGIPHHQAFGRAVNSNVKQISNFLGILSS